MDQDVGTQLTLCVLNLHTVIYRCMLFVLSVSVNTVSLVFVPVVFTRHSRYTYQIYAILKPFRCHLLNAAVAFAQSPERKSVD